MSRNVDMIDEKLMRLAAEAMPRAYAPYSNFQVGAAILDDKGATHTGVNVENAAYPQGSCAEAGAIAAMVLDGGRKIEAIAVAGRGDVLCTPCGGCRQRIREFASPNIRILVGDENGIRQVFTLEDLLPASFGPDNLG